MTRITRPTLADLWRAALARLEGQGAVDAPAQARALAIAALTGRPVGASAGRVGREGQAMPGLGATARPSAPANPRCRKMACASH